MKLIMKLSKVYQNGGAVSKCKRLRELLVYFWPMLTSYIPFLKAPFSVTINNALKPYNKKVSESILFLCNVLINPSFNKI